jgi:hypothetical protein
MKWPRRIQQCKALVAEMKSLQQNPTRWNPSTEDRQLSHISIGSDKGEMEFTEYTGEEHQETVRRVGLRHDTEDTDQGDGYQHSGKTSTCDVSSSKPIDRCGDDQDDDQLNTIGDAGDGEWVGNTCRLEKVCCVCVELGSVWCMRRGQRACQSETQDLLTGQSPGADNRTSLITISSTLHVSTGIAHPVHASENTVPLLLFMLLSDLLLMCDRLNQDLILGIDIVLFHTPVDESHALFGFRFLVTRCTPGG